MEIMEYFTFVYFMQTEKGTDIDTQIKLKYIFDPKKERKIDRVFVGVCVM